MSNLVHFSVDIETLDVIPSAVILSIGAVEFDPKRGDWTGPFSYTLYNELALHNQFERTTSKSTQDWWMNQPVEVRPFDGTIHLKGALHNLSDFLSIACPDLEARRIWCKGTDFDTVILAHAYKQLGIPVPWKYNAIRDARTLYKLFPGINVSRSDTEIEHNALGDASYQARRIQAIATAYPNICWE